MGTSDLVGQVLHFDGASWSNMTSASGTTENLRAVWASGGKAWNSTSPGGYLYGVWGSGTNDVFAVGHDTILRWCGP